MTPDEIREHTERAVSRGDLRYSRMLRVFAELSDASIAIKQHLDNKCQPAWEGPKLRTRLDGVLITLREL